MRTSEVADGNSTLVKEDDKISFTYNGDEVIANIKYHNGLFIVATPDNKPMSCMLSGLKEIVGDFTVTI